MSPQCALCVCLCGEVFSLEPQGNDFTSFGQLGFLLTQTMSGCGALNLERQADERQKGGGGKDEEKKRKKHEPKEESGLKPGWPILDLIKSFTTEQNSTADQIPQRLVN